MDNFETAKLCFFEGVNLFEKQLFQEAESKFLKSLELIPDRVSTLTNLSAVQIKLEKFEEAKVHAERATILDDKSSEAWLNLGIIESKNSNITQALTYYDRAISLDPTNVEALSNKGKFLYEIKRYDEAQICYDKAISLKPEEANFYFRKAMVNRQLCQFADAIQNLESAIKYNIDSPERAEFIISALKGEKVPERMPDSYVADLFDGYADKFESHLVESLKYKSPGTLYSLLKDSLVDNLEILDLGCGTGLMGPMLKPHASKLLGVDLSEKMLEKATSKKVYDRLVAADINEFVKNSREQFDLIIAADVFVYIGDLADIFMNVGRLLRKPGYFGFTAEKCESGRFSLSPDTLRYSHSKAYLEDLARSHGFKIKALEEDVIREERGANVPGYYLVVEKI